MSKRKRAMSARHLVLILGDQLDARSAAFDDLDAKRDVVWMAEVHDEASHVASTKTRTAVFLAAMRHFRDELTERGIKVDYRSLDDDDGATGLADALELALDRLSPEKVLVVQPGEHRVLEMLVETAQGRDVELEVLTDRHFFSTPDDFAAHAEGRKQLRLEYFYRELRREHDVLMDGDEPAGGDWNYDSDNRKSFGKSGPEDVRSPRAFEPDATTREVLELVEREFPDRPGDLDRFDWPVTRKDARKALSDFIRHRLPSFGDFQDAMWTDEPWLYHSRLSQALNLKLLDPRDVVAAAEKAYRESKAPLNAVEGFIRQVLGWREYIRGVYWHFMPEYAERNHLDADRDLPAFYWSGETEMTCLAQALDQTLRLGYAHHIQRLMVTGLFAMLLGVKPREIHEWYLAVYVDAVEWVELPNVLGMSQFADGGLMSSKPYCASGAYINRMSNYCRECRFEPSKAAGEDACPFTTLYWDFLARHRKKLDSNRRMTMQLRNLDRKDAAELRAIRRKAKELREELCK